MFRIDPSGRTGLPNTSREALTEQWIFPAFQILNLNTRLFLNSPEMITDEILKIRISAGMNNTGFIACHMLDGRFYPANYNGISYACPLKGLFSQINSIDEY